MRSCKWMWGISLVLCSFAAIAANNANAVRKQIELSMLVTGTLEIDTQGTVALSSLDEEAKLPPGVVTFLKDNIVRWRFEPAMINGAPARLRNRMSLLVVAKKLENGDYAITLRNASFDPAEAPGAGTQIASEKMSPPSYPREAAMAGAQATVYLIVKIGRDGQVTDVAAEQVNMRSLDSEANMDKWRAVFAKAALKVATRWKFRIPTAGDQVDAPYWQVRVPCDFFMQGGGEAKYGQWKAYVPGPREQIPWADTVERPGFAPDALAAGGIYPINRPGLRLLTPLDGT